MKKLLAIAFVAALGVNVVCAGVLSDAVKSTAKAAKADAKASASSLRSAVKTDVENAAKAHTSTATAKKAEKIKQIDNKIADLNKQLTTVKKDKTITETERTLKMQRLQSKIDFYNKEKAALQ